MSTTIALTLVGINALAVAIALWTAVGAGFDSGSKLARQVVRHFFIYEGLCVLAMVMLLPFYWMVVTAFKDQETAIASPPIWGPVRNQRVITDKNGNKVPIRVLETRKKAGELVKAVPESKIQFKAIEEGGFRQHKEVPDEKSIIMVDPDPKKLPPNPIFNLDPINFFRAWYAPEISSRGKVDFGQYFYVSTVAGILTTIGTLLTSALAAFALAKLNFFGKGAFFYVVLVTMMIPGQVLLIPDFLILSNLGMLDSYAALIVPWLASVFTIFLMRQFFMTIPDDLWDAAQIDGSSRLRFLLTMVIPLSKPVFITAGIFAFLGNWNSLLWPLIVTSSPNLRTLMVGLQALNEEGGQDFHTLMAASTLAILPVVILFFFMQRFFIEGIARTGLK